MRDTGKGRKDAARPADRPWTRVAVWVASAIGAPIFVSFLLAHWPWKDPALKQLKVADVDCYRSDFSCEVSLELQNTTSAELLLRKIVFTARDVATEQTLGEFLIPVRLGVIEVDRLLVPGQKLEYTVERIFHPQEIEKLTLTMRAAKLKKGQFVSLLLGVDLDTSQGNESLGDLSLKLPWDFQKSRSIPEK